MLNIVILKKLIKIIHKSEIVTDWVKLRWGYYNEKDAYEAFDDNEKTSITMDPAIHGHVAKLYAVFYYQVSSIILDI